MRTKASIGWLKRNRFIVGGAITALSLLGVAGYFEYSNYEKDKAVTAALLAKIDELKGLTARDPFPNNENIRAAKREQGRCHAYLKQAGKYLAPTSIPGSTKLDPAAFKALLENTIFELKRQAEIGKISLPPDYAFTFSAERPKFRFAPGSLDPLAAQLADIKAICGVLFDSKVHAITAIRRAAVSPDDPAGSVDYLARGVQTNRTVGAIISPYEISFVGFTKELDEALTTFAQTQHGIIVRSLAVESSSSAAALAGIATARPGFGDRPMLPPNPIGPPIHPTFVPGTTHGLTTVLQEKPLQITLSLEVIRLIPSKQL